MKESKDRTDQFMSSTAASTTQPPTSTLLTNSVILTGLSDLCADSLLFGSRNADLMGDGSVARPDAKGKGKARPNGDVLSLDMVEEGYGSNANGPFAQMQLVEQQVRLSTPTPLYWFHADFTFKRIIGITYSHITGRLHPTTLQRNRIHRIHHLRTRPDLHAARAHGRRAARNRTTHRRRHDRHRLERVGRAARAA